MSDKPAFVVHHIDQTTMPITTTSYLTRNWEVRVSDNQMHFVGTFHNLNGGVTQVVSQRGGQVIEVKLAGQRDEELLQEAEDKARVNQLAEHLIGLTEKFIDSNLSHEFKEILSRTPSTVAEMGDLMAKGLKKALDKLGKGK